MLFFHSSDIFYHWTGLVVGKKLQNLAHVLLSKPFVLLTICQCCKVITWLRYMDSQPS